MDRDTLYLDNDEEITSVVDKLKGTERASVDLVIPKDALLLQSVVNLKLLRKQAQSLGKEITIVTQDKVGTKLAEQIGIPVVAKVGQEPKVVNMSEADAPGFSEEDIQMKEGKEEAPKEVDSLLEETEEVVPVAAVKEKVSDLPPEELKNAPRSKKGNWQKKAIAGGFAAIILLVLAYIFIPLANVNVKLAAQKEQVDVSFKVDKEYNEVDATAETIPAKIVTEEREVSEKYQATGKKKVGERATGTVTLYNAGYDSDPVTIVAGTRLATSGGLLFRTNTNVTIPGSYLDKGAIVTTSIDVVATADQVGENYNIEMGKTLSVPAIGNSKIYGKSKSAFTGGSSRDVTYVTQADINKAKTEIGKNAETEIRSALAQKIEEGEQLLEKAVKFEQDSVSSTQQVNAEVTDFELKAKYKATAIVFKDDDLKKLAEKVLGDKIGSTKEIVESGSLINTTEFIEADFEKGTMSARLSGEAYITEKLDQEKLKVELTGEKEAKAISYLSEVEGIQDVQVRFFPSFYKRMPRIKSHIYLKTEIIKQ